MHADVTLYVDGATHVLPLDTRTTLLDALRDHSNQLSVAASTFPARVTPGSTALLRYGADGRFHVEIGAADIGTGTWTALSQIAADALGCRSTRSNSPSGARRCRRPPSRAARWDSAPGA